jgi:hypothetical protein
LKHKNCVAVGSDHNVIDKNGNYLYNSTRNYDWDSIKAKLPEMPFAHSSVMFRKTVAQKCGFYNEKLPTSQDIVLFNRMANYGELRNIREGLVEYRIVPFALSTNTKKVWEKKKDIINKAILQGKISDSDSLIFKNIRTSQSKRFRLGNYYSQIGIIYIRRNFQKRKAIKNLFFSILYYPTNLRSWFYLILAILPPFFIKKRNVYLNNKAIGG